MTPYYFNLFYLFWYFPIPSFGILLGFTPDKSPATATCGSLLHRGAGTSSGRLRGAENRGETDGYSG